MEARNSSTGKMETALACVGKEGVAESQQVSELKPVQYLETEYLCS